MNCTKAVGSAAAVVLLLVGAWSIAYGQGISRGTITGSVADATGAVIPGVQVTVTNAATGEVRVVESNESGVYVVSAIAAGDYDIAAELAGFQRQVLRGISLEAEQRLGVNLELQVGEVTTTVEVSGAAPVLDTESGEVSALISSVQVAEMPINGRNWSQFGRLAAGVAAEATDQRGIGQEGNPLLAVHGTRTDKVRYAIDGIQNMDTGGQRGINNFPPPEAIAEVKFLTSNFNAESGSYGGGVGNIVIKGGSQEFHGDFYNFLRNNVMDSANFFATEAAPLKQNHFGFTLGGPISFAGYNADKTKTFFFTSISQYKRRGPSMRGATCLARTPTQAMRMGDFTGERQISDPDTGEPFPNNMIPQDRIDPNATILLENFYPLPNRVGGQNWIAQPSQPTDQHEELVRIDHNFSDNVRLMARYIQDDWTQIQHKALWSAHSFDTIHSSYSKPGKNLVASLTNIVSPTMVNEFTFGFSWNTIHRPLLNMEQRPGGLDIPELFAENPGNKIPDIRLGQGWGSISAANVPYDNGNPMLTFRDDLTKQVGNHSLKFGTEILWIRKWIDSSTRPQGSFLFNGGATGHAVADFLVGRARTYQEQEGGNLQSNFIAWQKDFYAQDDWKVNQNLTLNYGIRWSIFQGVLGGEEHGRISSFMPELYDPSQAVTVMSNGRIVPGSGALLNGLLTPSDPAAERFGGHDLYRQRFTNFGPRLGLAYKISDRSVVRAGGGVYYGPGHIGRFTTQPPIVQQPLIFDTKLSDPAGGTTDILLPSNVSGHDPEGLAATSYQWSFGIQQEIVRRTSIDITYVGNRGVHLGIRPNLNRPAPDPNRQGSINAHRPFPGFANVLYQQPSASSTYNGLEITLRRRFVGGFMLESAYTLSRTWSHGDNIGDTVQDPRNLAAEWSLADFDRTHISMTNFLYELPFFKRQDTAVKKVFGGWTIAGIVSLQSGRAGGPTLAGDNGRVGGGGPQRPNLVGEPNSGPQSLAQWFNTSAFEQPARGTFGNSPRAPIRLPGLTNFDLTLAKNTQFNERVRMQLRAEFFNAFNHPQWNGVALGFNNSIFGRVTSAHDPRIMQIGLKISF